VNKVFDIESATEYWNLAVQISTLARSDTDRVQAMLRDISLGLMEKGLSNQTISPSVQTQLVDMMYKAAKAYLKIDDTAQTAEYIKKATELLKTISGLSNEKFNTLKYQLKLLQVEIEWKNQSDSSFYIANVIVNECVPHLDGNQVQQN
jgi:hypothetical protein